MSASIVRPKCLENMKNGLPPQKWMGKKIAAIELKMGVMLIMNGKFLQLSIG